MPTKSSVDNCGDYPPEQDGGSTASYQIRIPYSIRSSSLTTIFLLL